MHMSEHDHLSGGGRGAEVPWERRGPCGIGDGVPAGSTNGVPAGSTNGVPAGSTKSIREVVIRQVVISEVGDFGGREQGAVAPCPDGANDHRVGPDLMDRAQPAQAAPGQDEVTLAGFDAEWLEIQTGAMRVAATFEPPMVSIDGDIDTSVLPALVGTLAKVAHHGRGDVRVDLGRLRRVDVGGLRALVASAGNLNRDGRRLVLHAVAPWLLGLLIVTGWDDAPGLRLIPGPVPTG